MLRSKLLVGLLMMVLLVGSASAVIDVDCGSGWIGSVCHDYELQDEFNAQDWRDDKQDAATVKALNKANRAKVLAKGAQADVDVLDEYVGDNEGAWLIDGGVSMRRVKSYLLNTFVPYLDGLFARKSVVSDLEARVFELETANSELVLMVHYVSLGYTDIHYTGSILFGRSPSGVVVRLN